MPMASMVSAVSRSIDEAEGGAGDVDGVLDGVAGGAGDVGDDGPFLA